MAYYSLGKYDADVRINSFTGLYQYGDGMNGDVRFAADEMNVETPAGVLQPQAATEVLDYTFEGYTEAETPKIETLAHLYRRWYFTGNVPEVLVAAVAGHLYYRIADETGEWHRIAMPSGMTEFQSNVWSWVNYEKNNIEGATSPVDVLVISNAYDGMFLIYEDPIDPQHPFVIQKVIVSAKPEATESDYNFGVIARYAERIWGAGILDEPDTLVYSATFHADAWGVSPDEDAQPEDTAGEIRQPSWDGDSFTALTAFGSQLIALKKHRVWRILGTDPGEYTFKEQYGGGAPYPNTIAVDVERIFMAEKEGVSVYDGLAVTGYQREGTEAFWRTVNPEAMDQMCGVIFQNKYYLAVPTGESTVNNEMLVFNLRDNTILRYTGIYIEAFLATDDVLYATSSTEPGKVLKLNWDSWQTGMASGQPVKWVSPWMDFSYKKIQKGGFDLYFTPEVQDSPVTFTFSIQTEKKVKTKKYTVQPLTAVEKAGNKNYKQKRLHFGGKGRRFRLIIETDAGVTAPWRLIGGIQMVVETDPD